MPRELLTNAKRAEIKLFRYQNPFMSQKRMADHFKITPASISKALNDVFHECKGDRGPFHTVKSAYTEHSLISSSGSMTYRWEPRVRTEALKLPVVDNGFIRPPTREQLMGCR